MLKKRWETVNLMFIRYFAKLTLAFFLLTLVLSSNASAAAKKYKYTGGDKPIVFPVLPAGIDRLFYLQRMPNTNTLVYELNVDKKTGMPDEDEPVHPYWIRYADKGQKEELNYIQRKFAYGLVQKKVAADKYDIRFVSYKKFPLTLMKSADGKYHIFATIAQKLMALDYIFIKIEGGSFWLPNVVYVELKGTDPATGKEITERFKP